MVSTTKVKVTMGSWRHFKPGEIVASQKKNKRKTRRKLLKMMSPNRGSINRTNQRKDHFSQTLTRRTMSLNSTAFLLGKRVEQCQIRRI